ncbi:MAG: aldolase [Rhodospirillales bacterium]
MNSLGNNAVESIELDERQARIDLAAAFRLAGRMDMVEGVGNHFSYLLPGEPARFLINARGQHFSEMSAGHFLTANPDGEVLAGQGELRPVAFFIHSRIHLARPEARCVLHAHPPYATALTMVEGGHIVGAHQLILRLGNRIAYDDDYNGIALDEAEGDRIAATMGDATILMMGCHGVTVVGPTVADAFDQLYFLERMCRYEVFARSTGLPLRAIGAELRASADHPLGHPRYEAQEHFAALKRQLDREEPDYQF